MEIAELSSILKPTLGNVVVARVYKGDHFPDLKGKAVTVAELAERLNVSPPRLRGVLRRNQRVRSTGTIIDDDIKRYIEAAKPVELACSEEYSAHRALMAKKWGSPA